jgi:2-alkenal reductase
MTRPAAWGDSDSLRAGETVIAIGSPLGDFVNTVTVGVISNVSRAIDVGQGFQLQDLIQTDAAINRGNSGGPLLNLSGEVIGINTLIVRGNGADAQAEGLGFAIPSNTAKEITEQIIEQGEVSRPYLGIEWRWITPQISDTFDLPVDYGVFVTGIVPNSPAAQAGLQRGDLLVSFGGQTFDQDHPFINLLFQFRPGDTVDLEFIRARQPKQSTSLRLGELPDS